jgi:hypothetical protein
VNALFKFSIPNSNVIVSSSTMFILIHSNNYNTLAKWVVRSKHNGILHLMPKLFIQNPIPKLDHLGFSHALCHSSI